MYFSTYLNVIIFMTCITVCNKQYPFLIVRTLIRFNVKESNWIGKGGLFNLILISLAFIQMNYVNN